MEILHNDIVLLALTFGTYFAARQCQKKTGWVIMNPILLTIALLILFLKVTGISYETYHKAGSYIDFWLKPAIVALGVPPLPESLADTQAVPAYLPLAVGRLCGRSGQRSPHCPGVGCKP